MARFTVWVIKYPLIEAFHELAEGLVHSLRRLGHVATLALDVVPPAHGGRLILIAAHRLGTDGVPRCALPAGSILYNFEQASAPETISFAESAYTAPLAWWDYSARNIEVVRCFRGGRVVHCPIGYVPELAQRIPPRAVEPEIDVLFYGSLNARRSATLTALGERGLRPRALFNTWGALRDVQIAKAKLVLNHHFYDRGFFEIARCSYLMANGVPVVSELGVDPLLEAPYREGISFARYDELVDRCVALVSDDAARAALARRGYEAIRAQPQEEFVRRALEETDR